MKEAINILVVSDVLSHHQHHVYIPRFVIAIMGYVSWDCYCGLRLC